MSCGTSWRTKGAYHPDLSALVRKLTACSVDEEEIDTQCDTLRKKLVAEMERASKRGEAPRRGFKMHQVHEQANAKIKETERFRSALKISKDYEEGGHWKRREERLKKALEREAEEKEREGEGGDEA